MTLDPSNTHCPPAHQWTSVTVLNAASSLRIPVQWLLLSDAQWFLRYVSDLLWTEMD